MHYSTGDFSNPAIDIHRAERNHGLDFLRGLAAFGIVVFHYLLMAHAITVQSLGTFGVYLFFMMSGLTMMLVYAPKFSSAISLHDAVHFYRNRIARILPLLCAVATINLALTVLSKPSIQLIGGSAISSFLTGSGLFALRLPGYLSNVMGAWSLGIEIAFYAAFPVVCLLANNARFRTLLIAVAVLIVAQQAMLLLLQRMSTEDPERFWHYYTTPLMFAPFFAIGIIVYRSRSSASGFYAPLALALAGLIATHSLFTGSNPLQSNVDHLVLTVLSTAALFCFYHMTTPRILTGLASFLGNISYALYLTHPLVFTICQKLSAYLSLGPYLAAVLFFVTTLATAQVTFFLFERRIRSLLRAH